VDETIKAAEADFARGDLDKAREGYLRAFLLDPNNYDAALFIGDVYFKQHTYGSAGEWFSRAVLIDPNRETAYRYWGDALLAMGKGDDARAKFIEAIVADPYNSHSWVGLTNWLQRNKLELNNVRLKDGATVTEKGRRNQRASASPRMRRMCCSWVGMLTCSKPAGVHRVAVKQPASTLGTRGRST
jgi:tetratricopeptide (TPR) repeat protein